MGRPGDCSVCRRRDRKAIDAAHAGGMSIRGLAREFGASETSLRRHLAHVEKSRRAKPSPKPEPLVMVQFREDLERTAATLGIPFADAVFHRLYCERKHIAVRTEAEADEFVELMRQHATDEEFAEMFCEGSTRGHIWKPREPEGHAHG